jgi:hypothetical protein
VRRRPGRSPQDEARLRASLVSAAALLRLESRRRRVVFRGNFVASSPEFSPTAERVSA